ncbi:MAG: hypothetical protein ACOYOK_05600 [Pseudobdellovibrionaceae bacterium]
MVENKTAKAFYMGLIYSKVVAIIFFIGCAKAMAFQSAYSFGGACQSQGSWTQSVLAQSEVIKNVIENLRDNPDCTDLINKTLSYLSEIKNNPALNNNPGSASFSELAAEVSGLGGVLKNTPFKQSTIANAMITKSADLQAANNPILSSLSEKGAQQSSYQKAFNASKSGLDGLSHLASAIENNQKCAIPGEQAGVLLSGLVYSISSFAAGGDNANGASIAQAVASVTKLIRSERYNKVLRKLGNAQFSNSVRCLLEVTSESYCTIKDNIEMLMMNVESLKAKVGQQKIVAPDVAVPKTPMEIRNVFTNPFSGLYVLNQHIPNVTKYVQKVLMGNNPTTIYESRQKEDVEIERSKFIKARLTLLGIIGQGQKNVNSQDSLLSKRTEAVKTITSLAGALASSDRGFGSESATNKNFFETYIPETDLPFELLGLPKEQWPCQVYNIRLCKSESASSMSYEKWLMLGAASATGEYSFLHDPEVLMQKVDENLNKILNLGEVAFNIYYSTWFLPDQTALVEQVFIGRPTVYDSLMAVSKYLEDFEARSKKIKYEKSSILLSKDTRIRINQVLNKLYQFKKSSYVTNDLDNLKKQSQSAITDLYTMFNVQQSLTGFLQDRLQKIVTMDYQMMLDSGVDFSDYQKKLLFIMGENIATNMTNLLGKPWQQLQSDLLNASNLSLTNLEAIEDVFSDHLVRSTAQIRLVAQNIQPTKNNIYMDARQRLIDDSTWLPKNRPDDWKMINALKNTLKTVDPISFIWRQFNAIWHSDRYSADRPGWAKESSSPDTTFRAGYYIYAQSCIQSLAFNDWKRFEDLCRGVILPSIFDSFKSEMTKEEMNHLEMAYDLIKNDKKENMSENHDQRICAFRDYYRNNYIFQVAIGLENNASNHELTAPPKVE